MFKALHTNGPVVGGNPKGKSMADGSTFVIIIKYYAERGPGIAKRGSCTAIAGRRSTWWMQKRPINSTVLSSNC